MHLFTFYIELVTPKTFKHAVWLNLIDYFSWAFVTCESIQILNIV